MKNIRLIVASAGLLTALVVSTIMPASVAAKPKTDDDNKVTICHRNDDVKQPYGPKAITVDENGLDGHGDHTGPLATSEAVAQSYKNSKIMWGDIIPPTPDLPNGLNWTTQAKAMWDNGCQFVTEVTPTAVSFADPTCDANGTYTIPTTTGVNYLINGQTVATGTYTAQNGTTVTVTAQAQKGYFIADGTTASWSKTFNAANGCGGQVLGTSTSSSTPTQVSVTPSGGVSAGAGGGVKASVASIVGFASSIGTVAIGLLLRRKWAA